ncbi:MAG: hypothetical protein IBX63_05155 [Coriobacteriia bacterium]|nr:hypothetical protein [Coriobacteriia bacterium]
MAMYDYPSKDEVLVGGTEYAAKELWSATEGMQVEGDRIDMTRMMSSSRKAHVFHEDPETGEFTYLGAESAEVWW